MGTEEIDENFFIFIAIIKKYAIRSKWSEKIAVPQSAFLEKINSPDELKDLFVQTEKQGLIKKKEILFGPDGTTPSTTLDLKLKPIKGYHAPWYIIEVVKEKIKHINIPEEPIKIKDIRLDEKYHLLIVNNGFKTVSFNTKNSVNNDNENKQFRILFHLWEFRFEFKNGKNINENSDFCTLENLKRGGGCLTSGAVLQHIKRLNDLFRNKGLKVSIESKKGSFRLVVYINE